jgi:Rrf2 family protein
MDSILNISDAASIGMHTMALLATDPEQTRSAGEIAEEIHVSENHLAKVMQRLSQAGLVNSKRGPGGGFTLAKSADDITLLEIFETIDGPIETGECPLGMPVCTAKRCILGDMAREVTGKVKQHFEKTTLSELADVYGGLSDT